MNYILLITIILVGCSVNQRDQSTFEGTCDQFSESRHLTWNVQTKLGDSLLVTLCSNPTTGFQWRDYVEISDENILNQTSHDFFPPGKTILGSSGLEQWTLNSLKKGTSVVVWEYSRPWEGGEKKEWSLTATVVVD
ncbi:protease inhibitor I42 family protein [Chloroflexi bacterium]|nr:protease inhibitor I42 family protein [Chloroflexota bacterium]